MITYLIYHKEKTNYGNTRQSPGHCVRARKAPVHHRIASLYFVIHLALDLTDSFIIQLKKRAFILLSFSLDPLNDIAYLSKLRNPVNKSK